MKLLIIDDEPVILETVEARMRRDGHSTFTAASAEEGIHLFRRVRPDLVILDVMLPHRSGFDFCRVVRQESSTPIIIISARSEESDRIQGLDLGADDYLVKPFSLGELSARVKAILRRSAPEMPNDRIQLEGLVIDPQRHEASLGGRALDLSPKEFALLYFLACNPGQVFSREALLDRVWGHDAYVTPRTVDVHMRWLRTHVEEDPNLPKRLLTVRGVGYKFAG